MGTIRSFAFAGAAAALAACATQPSRTLPALPDPPAALQLQQPLVKTPSGDYPDYQRIVVDGQELYCRQNQTKNPRTDSKVTCLTEAQLQTEHLLALQAQVRRTLVFETATRPPTPNLNSVQAGVQAQQNFANLPAQYGGQR